MANNILVTGCNGQLGSGFKNLSSKYPEFNFFFKDIDLDISNKQGLKNFILNNNINIILNTAAYTDVNKAEIEKEKADLINSFGVNNLVELSEKYHCKLIHFSTDYVYDSVSSEPIDEDASTNPLNYYGKSKRKGEIFIEKSFSESIIIRTSWLYSYYGSNFVNTIIKKAIKEKKIDKRLVMLSLMDSKPGEPLLLHDEPIYLKDKIIGVTTSGNFSFNFNKNLSFGYINSDLSDEQLNEVGLYIEIEKKKYQAELHSRPLKHSNFKTD